MGWLCTFHCHGMNVFIHIHWKCINCVLQKCSIYDNFFTHLNKYVNLTIIFCTCVFIYTCIKKSVAAEFSLILTKFSMILISTISTLILSQRPLIALLRNPIGRCPKELDGHRRPVNVCSS